MLQITGASGNDIIIDMAGPQQVEQPVLQRIKKMKLLSTVTDTSPVWNTYIPTHLQYGTHISRHISNLWNTYISRHIISKDGRRGESREDKHGTEICQEGAGTEKDVAGEQTGQGCSLIGTSESARRRCANCPVEK